MQFLLKDVCQVDHLHIHFSRTRGGGRAENLVGSVGKEKLIDGNLTEKFSFLILPKSGKAHTPLTPPAVQKANNGQILSSFLGGSRLCIFLQNFGFGFEDVHFVCKFVSITI